MNEEPAAVRQIYGELANAFEPIGEIGGYGQVFEGMLDNKTVSIKRLKVGRLHFVFEVVTLGDLHHPNIINLIGYCSSPHQRVIVYEYMPQGSLALHLHNEGPGLVQSLDWNTRMKIATGIARGLKYLHTEANPPVIYGNLKTTNVLLNDVFEPKLSDFGSSLILSQDRNTTHLDSSPVNIDTLGYYAPEQAGMRLSLKSDVYNYGVLLLEIITGRRARDGANHVENNSLVDFVVRNLVDYRFLEFIVDVRLNRHFPIPICRKVMELAVKCASRNPENRPTMERVVDAMEFLSDPKNANTSECYEFLCDADKADLEEQRE